MYQWSILCEEAKIKLIEVYIFKLCEIDEEAIWESWFTCFFFSFYFVIEIAVCRLLYFYLVFLLYPVLISLRLCFLRVLSFFFKTFPSFWKFSINDSSQFSHLAYFRPSFISNISIMLLAWSFPCLCFHTLSSQLKFPDTIRRIPCYSHWHFYKFFLQSLDILSSPSSPYLYHVQCPILNYVHYFFFFYINK